jgi:hypothetical protein
VGAVIILNNLSSDKLFGFGNSEPATSQQHDKLFMKAHITISNSSVAKVFFVQKSRSSKQFPKLVIYLFIK